MAKKINIETNTSALTREELATLAKVSNDVFYFSLFTYVIHQPNLVHVLFLFQDGITSNTEIAE